MKSNLQYTAVPLDRADALRRSSEKLAQLWQSELCCVLPLHNEQHLVTAEMQPVVAGREGAAVLDDIAQTTFLGLQGGTPYFSLHCTAAQATMCLDQYSDSSFIDLRHLGAGLDGNTAALLAYARGISFWQRHNGYCSLCGSPNRLIAGGHTMQCVECDRQTFPRTDPAVIMLVEHIADDGQKKCLLGRSPAWPEGCYSTLAGFVETGESLEAAVVREVFEETGIEVENPRYISSQPWPFPQSIMLGFVTTAKSTRITLDPQELADAGWYSADELLTFGEWQDPGAGLKLPRKDSIARFLINQWIRNCQKS